MFQCRIGMPVRPVSGAYSFEGFPVELPQSWPQSVPNIQWSRTSCLYVYGKPKVRIPSPVIHRNKADSLCHSWEASLKRRTLTLSRLNWSSVSWLKRLTPFFSSGRWRNRRPAPAFSRFQSVATSSGRSLFIYLVTIRLERDLCWNGTLRGNKEMRIHIDTLLYAIHKAVSPMFFPHRNEPQSKPLKYRNGAYLGLAFERFCW